jgi:hypothetical protein
MPIAGDTGTCRLLPWLGGVPKRNWLNNSIFNTPHLVIIVSVLEEQGHRLASGNTELQVGRGEEAGHERHAAAHRVEELGGGQQGGQQRPGGQAARLQPQHLGGEGGHRSVPCKNQRVTKQVDKGTGSRDRIEIFGQRLTVLVVR